MKFKKYLNELFDTSVSVKMKSDSPGLYYEFTFKIDDKFFLVTCTGINRSIDDIIYYEIAFSDEKFRINITGILGGNASKVFAGVIKSVRMFLEFKKPEYFYFTAKESSRKKLYDDFSKMIIKNFPYKMTKSIPKEMSDWLGSDKKIYLFKRN